VKSRSYRGKPGQQRKNCMEIIRLKYVDTSWEKAKKTSGMASTCGLGLMHSSRCGLNKVLGYC